MPRRSDKPNEPPDIKVFIRNARGKYLAQDANGLFFTEDRSAALVFNYRSDSVPEQLEQDWSDARHCPGSGPGAAGGDL